MRNVCRRKKHYEEKINNLFFFAVTYSFVLRQFIETRGREKVDVRQLYLFQGEDVHLRSLGFVLANTNCSGRLSRVSHRPQQKPFSLEMFCFYFLFFWSLLTFSWRRTLYFQQRIIKIASFTSFSICLFFFHRDTTTTTATPFFAFHLRVLSLSWGLPVQMCVELFCASRCMCTSVARALSLCLVLPILKKREKWAECVPRAAYVCSVFSWRWIVKKKSPKQRWSRCREMYYGHIYARMFMRWLSGRCKMLYCVS